MKTIGKYFKIAVKKIKKFFTKYLTGESESTSKKELRNYLKKAKLSAIDSRNAKLDYLKRRFELFGLEETKQAYLQEKIHVETVDKIFSAFNEIFEIKLEQNVDEINFNCLRTAVDSYQNLCMWGEYDLKYVRSLALACNKVQGNTEKIIMLLEQICLDR